jgi:D-alanyl-lipoteichoic acid acyltransferase DltB (MBOAT superfamily)
MVLLCIGLFQKAVMADALFAPIVDAVYADPQSYGALDAWAAVLGFSGQIYYDFSGYSLCAIGIALCFGFEFPDNFRHPYAARGFSDFWRRWHISLSTWMRDYLYIPMGGGRGAAWPRNLLVTMLVVGLWHGASWMFVLWGGLHGVYLALERAWNKAMRLTTATVAESRLAWTLLTFAVVTLTWIPFRAPDAGAAFAIAQGLLALQRPSSLETLQLVACFGAISGTLYWQIQLRDVALARWYASAAPVIQGGAVTLCLLTIFLFSGGDERSFIYFQF